MEGTRDVNRSRTMMALLLVLGAPALELERAHAQGTDAGVTVTAIRSWSAPSNTRIVLDFSKVVTPVAPDSGYSRELTISVPGEPMGLGPTVPAMLGVRDSVVDSVLTIPGQGGGTFRLYFRDSTHFKVFQLAPETDKPFRIVVDVSKPGGREKETERLTSIAAKKKRERTRLVVIDAGHGGDDPGARGPGGVIEKTVVLAVAKALVAELADVPGVQVMMTRDKDFFIPLRERYRIAEKAKADVFISIHANSSRRRGSGSGTEVYFLSLKGASDQAADDLADLENAADHLGGVPAQAENELVNVIYDIKRNAVLQQSQLLAESLLDQLAADRRLESRGVKQAGFVVLKSVEFPSVLVETAFINNPREAKLLRDPAFQKKMGKQLADGIKQYFTRAGISLDPAPASSAGGR
jgi:N-acetylmuramoyl-L-alanine amidase